MIRDLVPLSGARSMASRRRQRIIVLLCAIAFILLAICAGVCIQASRSEVVASPPPWLYGPSSARFAVVEFGDLECPYCRMYFPTLRAWVDTNSDVNWEWRYLPLADHEPASTQGAKIAECAGEVGGARLFWYTLEWLQQLPAEQTSHPEGLYDPRTGAAVKRCLLSDKPGSIVRNQQLEANRDSVTATPTLRLLDRQTGRTMMLTGVVSPETLSSALDALTSDR
jgi:protein-disulfide isomerase